MSIRGCGNVFFLAFLGVHTLCGLQWSINGPIDIFAIFWPENRVVDIYVIVWKHSETALVGFTPKRLRFEKYWFQAVQQYVGLEAIFAFVERYAYDNIDHVQ